MRCVSNIGSIAFEPIFDDARAYTCPYRLEFVSEVDEEVWFLRVIAIAEGGTERSNDGVIVVGNLSTDECAVIKYFLEFVGLLTCCNTQEYVMVFGDALLCLKLCCKEVLPHVLHVAYACEGHLLLYIMPEPFSSNYASEDGEDDIAYDDTSVKHRLQGKELAKGELHTAMGTDIIHS